MKISFSEALWNRYNSQRTPVIPDLKMRSPAEGNLQQGSDPVDLARALAAAGAPALSVVTEPRHFGGSPDLLAKIRQAVALPILRKDFIVNRDQLQESADLGANAVLLIASLLKARQLLKLVEDSLQLGLEPLVETHNGAEILAVKALKLRMLGINNRNIMQLEMDDGGVGNTEKLTGLVEPGVLIISESSLLSLQDVKRAAAAGAHAVLIGTAILKADDPVKMYRTLSEIEEKSHDEG